VEYFKNNELYTGHGDIKGVISSHLTQDFYGALEGKSLQVKKFKTLDIYRYIYRFCSEKLMQFINNQQFVIMLVYYLEHDKMKRIQIRKVFKKSVNNYYVAL
jgi:hypothetical protein